MKAPILAESLGRYVDHSPHGTSREVHLPCVGHGEGLLPLVGSDPHHEVFADYAETHIAARHEAQTAEHLALRQRGITADLLSDSGRQLFVEGHPQRVATACFITSEFQPGTPG